MPVIPPLLNPLSGLPKKKAPAPVTTYNSGLGGESKADAPFTSPIIPGTTQSTGTSGGFNNPLTTSVPGFTPDYAGLLASDPLLGQTRADLSAQGVTDAASRNALINRALVQFGGTPDLAGAQKALGFNLGELVDPETSALAAQNQYSTTATLGNAHTDAIRQLRRALAARGGLQSGELGFQLDREGKAYGGALNDASQGLFDKLGGYQSQYAAGQAAAAAALRQAQQEAALRTAQLNPPTGSSTASFAYVDANGQPVYQHADGSYYNLDGSRYNGPGQGQAPVAQQQQAPEEDWAPEPAATPHAAPRIAEFSSPIRPTGDLFGGLLSGGGGVKVTPNLPNAYLTNRNKRG